MAGKNIAVDIGSHSIKVLAAKSSKHGVILTRFQAVQTEQGMAALAGAGLPLGGVVCGLAGRDMNLRYSQVPPTPDWQLKNLMELEIQDLSQQSGGSLSADYNLLPTQDAEAGVDTVLLALAKDDALDRLRSVIAEAKGTVSGYTPNCIALYNAYLKCGPVEQDAVVCLANLGHETIDIALVKGTDLLFARNLSGGGKVLDDAIAAAFNVSPRKAEALKSELLDLDPASRGRYASGQAEKVTMAAGGAANAIVAAIQSSLAFCKAQTKIADLRLDKVLVAGGSARLRGLRGLLREALRCPVELLDPFENLDLSQLPPGDAEQLQAMRYEAVVALGLAIGRLDDTLYALEVLPAAVRKRQQFQQRTVWNILAAGIAVAFLGLYWKETQASVDQATQTLARVRSAQSQSRSVHDAAQQLVEANKRDRAVVDLLASQAVPLHSAVRVMRAVTQNLPSQLWIRKFEVAQRGSSGAARKPVVEIQGSGKEIDGVEVGAVLQDYIQKLNNDASLKELIDKKEIAFDKTLPPSTSSTVEFTFTFSFGGKS
jgi:Tfp pilus assembly PilM family ATPase